MAKARGLKEAAKDPLVKKAKKALTKREKDPKKKLLTVAASFALGLAVGLLTKRFVRII